MRLLNALQNKLDTIAERIAEETHRREIIEAIEGKERHLRNKIVEEANRYLATREQLKAQEGIARTQAATATQIRIEREIGEQGRFSKNETFSRDKLIADAQRERFLLRQRFLSSKKELQEELDQIKADETAAGYQRRDSGEFDLGN